MTAPARIGVVGTGWWSTYTHLPALLARPDAEVPALCDTDAERLRAAAAAFGIARAYDNIETMLAAERLDAVIVATPHATHAAIAAACIERGLHVLLEKPMTLFAGDAQRLVELARRQQRALLVGYPWTYAEQPRRARELVASGSLGSIQYISCTFSSGIAELLSGKDGAERDNPVYPVHGPGSVYGDPQRSGGGMGHLQITHSAALALFVSGLRPARVGAFMQRHGLALDLVDAISVDFDGGALGIVGGTGNGIHRRLDLQIHGQSGGIVLDLVGGSMISRLADGSTETLGPLAAEADGYPRFAPAEHLVDVVLGLAAPDDTAIVGWHTVELLDAAYRSAAAGGRVVAVAELYG